MLHIIICDDNKLICNNIRNVVVEEMRNYPGGYEILVFNNGSNMLDCVNPGDDYLFLLDIDMPEISGFDVARKLKEMKLSDYIIFVTGHTMYALNSYEFHPFYYLDKAHISEKLPGQIREFIAKYIDDCGSLMLENGESIRIKEILFGTNDKHDILLHTLSGSIYRLRSTMAKLEQEYEIYGLAQIHRSYIVNFRHVRKVDKKDVILYNGVALPISINRRKDVDTAHLIYKRREK